MTFICGKVLLADDHPLVRDGIRYLLNAHPDKPTILEANSWPQTFHLIKLHQDLDLLLLDLTMPGMNGLSGVREARASIATTPLIILSMSEEPDQIQACLQLGVNGYIPKSSSTNLLLSAIEVVMNGGIYIPPHLLSSLQATQANAADGRDNHGADVHADNASITARQQEILRLIALGKTNKEIARVLTISDLTVKSHITNIFRQLSANNRTEAVHHANRLGLLAPQDED